MGFLTSLLRSIFGLGSKRRPVAPARIDDDPEFQFVPLEELDARVHGPAERELTDSMCGHLAPALLESIPAVAALTHALMLVSELADGLRARPSPKALTDARQRYLQQPLRTRLGDRPGVWVPVLRPPRPRWA